MLEEAVAKWVDEHSSSTIRKRLGLTKKQADVVKSGDFSSAEKLLSWAVESDKNYLIAEDLEYIEDKLGLSRAAASLLLGLDLRLYTKARNGGVVPANIGRYVRRLSGDPDFLIALYNCEL